MSESALLGLLGFLVLCLGVGAVGGFWSSQSVKTWYVTLRKPSWNPPPWIFGPVWSILYILMAVAAWLVWRKGEIGSLPGLCFGVQLALNLAWSYLFFSLRQPLWAFLEVLALWVAILGTLIAFWSIDTLAGILIIPYFAWVTFASALNAKIAHLNAGPRRG